MSRYFPHSAYAEDQPLAHTILGVHVLTRNFTVGTIGGAAVSGVRQLIPLLRGSATASSTAATATAAATAMKRVPFSQHLVLSAANGSLFGLGLGAAMLAARMYGREDIEWRDRSWRLMEHRGQLETDDWTYGGMAAGAGAALVARRSSPVLAAAGWKGLVGAAALGGLGGTVGYVVWRHGINGGVFPGEEGKEKDVL
ncbi:hypothetical protein HJFPF1_11390 [Paramyrothecium foliicola]|nr:hypothetical protein HJFPF1_11390 [Paramyrothecium foliicola]